MVGRTADTSDRFRWLRVLAVALFAVITVRLLYLQGLRVEHFRRLADVQRVRAGTVLPARGAIYLRERGTDWPVLVASTRFAPSAYVVPREVTDLAKVAEVLADIVLRHETRAGERREALLVETGQITKEEAEARARAQEARPPKEVLEGEDRRRQDLKNEFTRRFGNPTDPYEPVLAGGLELDAEAIAELQSANLRGVAVREVPQRAYPEGSLAAHLLGFVRLGDQGPRGEYGIEAGLDRLLRGEAGLTEAERDVAGRLISLGRASLVPPEHGADVVLTIDRILQTVAEDLAKDGRERFRAERAQVAVMDPRTGALLAIAAYPTFSPAEPGAIREVGVYQNPLVSDLIEPGSVFKPLVMAAALEHDLVAPDTTMVDAGPLRIGPYTINTYDGRHHGTITMTNILEHSNNIGMVWVAQQVGVERLFQFLRRLGTGERTGLPVSGEAAAPLSDPATWGETRLATAGFGQGIVTTGLHVLTATAALINGGNLLEPYVVAEVRYPDGTVEKRKPKVIRRVIRPEVSTQLRSMLASVVENGVAVAARVPGHYVGGKTGTAQVVDPETGRYATDKKIISFIGFAPVDDPAFIALIKLDNPAGLSFAAGTAAPLFGELAGKTLEYLRVPPARETVRDPLRAR